MKKIFLLALLGLILAGSVASLISEQAGQIIQQITITALGVPILLLVTSIVLTRGRVFWWLAILFGARTLRNELRAYQQREHAHERAVYHQMLLDAGLPHRLSVYEGQSPPCPKLCPQRRCPFMIMER